jgi:hypothetical protein
MENKDFCIFIISHGRADNIMTLKTLKSCGNTYPVYIVIDNMDNEIEKYQKQHINTLIFDKKKYADLTDEGDNFNNLRTTTHARNACYDLAGEKGYKYFLVLDDDYNAFSYIYNSKGEFKQRTIKNIDIIFKSHINYLKRIKAKAICFLQRGDLIGGGDNTALVNGYYPFKKRKAMNSWFCVTDRRIGFISRLNEDVNTYSVNGMRGEIYMTIPLISLNQAQTQSQSGGMSESYIDQGTYIKSFYSVMYRPDSYKIYKMGQSNKRYHHLPTWKTMVPQIIREKHKKQ